MSGRSLLRQRFIPLAVSRATSVWPRDERPRDTALGALPPFRFNALRGRALAGLPPALERLFIAFHPYGWERGIVAGPESTGHRPKGDHLDSAMRIRPSRGPARGAAALRRPDGKRRLSLVRLPARVRSANHDL